MTPSEGLLAKLNEQVGNELFASHQYVAIAAHFDLQGLVALARFFYAQSEEEREHAMKFVRYIVDAGGALRVPEVAAPQAEFASAEEAVRCALTGEEKVTAQIYALVDLARQDSDYIAQRFLDWFVDEQFEEVTTMGELLQVVERAGEDRLLWVEEYLQREGKMPAGEPG